MGKRGRPEPSGEVTSDEREQHLCFSWRPLLRTIRAQFWSAVDAPYFLLGIDPDRSMGDRSSPEGWLIIWLTRRPPGHYSSLDPYSLQMNVEEDLSSLRAALHAGGPPSFTPEDWIEWAQKRGCEPPWLEGIGLQLPRILSWRGRPVRVSDSARRERFVRAGKARYARTRYPEVKQRVWQALANAQGLNKRGRKAEFDREMADEHDVPERLVGEWRREWDKARFRR